LLWSVRIGIVTRTLLLSLTPEGSVVAAAVVAFSAVRFRRASVEGAAAYDEDAGRVCLSERMGSLVECTAEMVTRPGGGDLICGIACAKSVIDFAVLMEMLGGRSASSGVVFSGRTSDLQYPNLKALISITCRKGSWVAAKGF
jgi:hypothetical protein